MSDRDVAAEAIGALAVLSGCTERYFVGRKKDLLTVSCAFSTAQRSSVWIYGSRRMGKTALAEAAGRGARALGTVTVSVDASGLTYDELLERIVERAGGGDRGPAKKQLEAIVHASSATKPLLVIIDEMDSVAPLMATPQQAFFRRLKSENRFFAWIFVSSRSASELMEEVSDKNSRLAGICTHHRMRPLQREEVAELCERVAVDMGVPLIAECAAELFERYAGFPVALVSSLRALAVRAQCGELVDERDIKDAIQEAAPSLTSGLEDWWRSLSSVTRAELMLPTAPNTETRSELSIDGLTDRQRHPVRPTALIDYARARCDILPSVDPVDDLFFAVSELNLRCKMRPPHKDAFPSDALAWKFWILRRPCSIDGFRASIDYLYQLLWEKVRLGAGREARLRLPDSIADEYGSSQVIADINDLRNFLDHNHDTPRDAEYSNKDYRDAAAVFLRRCQREEAVTDEHREMVRASVIRDATILLQRLQQTLTV